MPRSCNAGPSLISRSGAFLDMIVGTMQQYRSALMMLLAVEFASAQSAITGLWTTGAGAPYTIAEQGSGKFTVKAGAPDRPNGVGWLQRTSSPGEFYGEMVIDGCWVVLSLKETEAGEALSGTLRVNSKKSTRGCRSLVTKEARAGEPSPFNLFRQSRALRR